MCETCAVATLLRGTSVGRPSCGARQWPTLLRTPREPQDGGLSGIRCSWVVGGHDEGVEQRMSCAAGQQARPRLASTRWLIVLIWGLLAGGAVVGRAWLDRPAWSGWLPLTVSYWSDLATLMSVGAAGLCSWLVLSLVTKRQGSA